MMLEKLEVIDRIVSPGLYITVVVLMIVEAIILSLKHQKVDHKGGIISALSGGLAFGTIFITNKLFLLALMYLIYDFRITTFGFEWYYWLVAAVLYDLMFYTAHRLGHEVRFFWCMHSVHHTSEEMRLTSGIRGSLFDFIYLPFFFLWIPVLGFHPLMIIILESFSRLYGVYTHIHESFVGKQNNLEKVFVTPSAHRVHHGKNIKYLDRNYGEVLTLWDRLFRTWQTEEEKPEYGILKEINSSNLLEIQFSPFKDLWNDVKSANSIADKLKYFIMPPGWHHEGNHTTAKILKANHDHTQVR